MATQSENQTFPSLEWCNTALRAAPFHTWLDLEVVAVGENSLELRMPWRDEIVSNPKLGSAHGGVLASLIDLAGFYALLVHQQPVAATATLSVDYHRAAMAGPLTVGARIVKVGHKLGTAESLVRSTEGELLAAGRGIYLMRE